MRKNLLNILECPYCASRDLEVYSLKEDELNYDSGRVKEVENGIIICDSCNRFFKITDFIPSFFYSRDMQFVEKMRGALSTDALRRLKDSPPKVKNPLIASIMMDGVFWGDYYNYLYENSILNFVDIREPFFPFYGYGMSLRMSWHERSYLRNEFELCLNNKVVSLNLHVGSRVLEIGCGSGWFSLELKRKEYDVIGVDPSFQALRVAKQYAIKKRFYIEYIQCHGHDLPFRDSIFDGLFAFHALHHIPDLEFSLINLRRVSKQNATISIYDHRKHVLWLGLITAGYSKILSFVIRKRYKMKTNLAPDFVRFKHKGKSVNEDISVNHMDSLEKYFDVQKIGFYHFLDGLPLMLYFVSGRNEKILSCGVGMVNAIERFLKKLGEQYCEFALYLGTIGEKY